MLISLASSQALLCPQRRAGYLRGQETQPRARLTPRWRAQVPGGGFTKREGGIDLLQELA